MIDDPYKNDSHAEKWINEPKRQYEQPKRKSPQVKISVIFEQETYLTITREILPEKMGIKVNKDSVPLKYTISDYIRDLVEADLSNYKREK